MRRQFVAQLDSCLQALPPKQGRAFVLRNGLEAETTDICSELGITANHLNVMLHRARKHLRATLQAQWLLPRPAIRAASWRPEILPNHLFSGKNIMANTSKSVPAPPVSTATTATSQRIPGAGGAGAAGRRRARRLPGRRLPGAARGRHRARLGDRHLDRRDQRRADRRQRAGAAAGTAQAFWDRAASGQGASAFAARRPGQLRWATCDR